MTNQEHLDNIAAAKKALDSAVGLASQAGLEVTVVGPRGTGSFIYQPQWAPLVLAVSRPPTYLRD